MDTSLKAARQYLFNDRSWASTGKTLNARVDTCLLRALRDMSGEVPQALMPEDFHVNVRKSIESGSEDVSANLVKTTDLKVLQFVIAAGSAWVPVTDGTWDGLIHIDITDPDGRIRRRQSREWWSDGAVPPTYYVSIDRPWYDTGTTAMAFRLHQPEFFLPGNTTKVLTPLRLYDESEQLVGQISSGSARRSSLPDINQRVTGQPMDFWRDRLFQMPTPTEAPRVSSIRQNANEPNDKGSFFGVYLPWLGPVQEGAFEFCYTYGWGRREQEWGESVAHLNDPVWESAPSPISTLFDHSVEMDTNKDGTSHGRAIVIECSNLEEMLDFMGDPLGVRADALPTYPPSGAPLRYGRSGLRIRIYVRRTEVYATHGPHTTAGALIQSTHRMNRTESDGKFYLLTELSPLDREPVLAAMTVPAYRVSAFAWQGAPINTATGQNNLLPDPSRQLRKITGYYAYRLWPLPDKDYDLDVSILRQPTELVNDNDQVPVTQDGFGAFMELALAYMCRLDGVDQAGEAKHRALYRLAIKRYRSLHGDNNGIVENQPWGSASPVRLLGLFEEG